MVGKLVKPMSTGEQRQSVVSRVQSVYGRWTRETTLSQMRSDWDSLFATELADTHTSNIDIDGLSCRWVSECGVGQQRVALYLHGGGFRMGSVDSHQELMARLSAASGCRVLGVDYRLCPEHAYPAALEDAINAYFWLLSQGFSADKIAIIGDSAGANLVAAMLNKLSTDDSPLPAAVVMMSPWLDMTATADTYDTRSEFDPIHQRRFVLALAAGYLGENSDPLSPFTSPLMGTLSGLPPMLIQVGDYEVGLGDAVDYAEKGLAAGGEVELEIWQEMIHVFQLFAADLPEAQSAIENVGQFLEKNFT